jgi:hypothetical protein
MDTLAHYLYLVPSKTNPIVHVLLEPKESTPDFYQFAIVSSAPCTDECTHLLFNQSVMMMLNQLSLETQNKYWNQSRSAIGNVSITHISEETQDDNTSGN